MILSDGTDTREAYSGPGKFEGEPQFAGWLWDASMDGLVDDETGSVDFGCWYGRIGRRVISEDSQGFVCYQRFETDADAIAYMGQVEAEYAAWEGED